MGLDIVEILLSGIQNPDRCSEPVPNFVGDVEKS